MGLRRLILMRHATATSGTGRDFDRPLSRRGLEEAHRVGERLREQGLFPDRVICSSARRCRETWQAVASGLGDEPSSIDLDDRLYNASTGALLDAIQTVEQAETLFVLAHNPGISLLGVELADRGAEGERQLRDGFAPATIAVFEVEGDWQGFSNASTRLLRFERAPSERER
jgi:phosphohistidine phosphatase